MDIEKEKLQRFTEAFLLEASQSAGQISLQVKAERKALLEKAERDLRTEAAAYIKKRTGEIRTREGSRISAQLLESKRQLFASRGKYAAEISALVQQRLADFAQTPEYEAHLAALLHTALSHLRGGSPVTLLLRPEDMRHQERLREASKQADIQVRQGGFTMGGLVVVCPAENLRIDMSFDTAYSDISGHFAELSGIDLKD